MTWRNRAACLDEDPELFFPVGNAGPAVDQIEEAKLVCFRCEVIGLLVLERGGAVSRGSWPRHAVVSYDIS